MLATGMQAQHSSVRTNKTIVADVLAQLPAKDQNVFNVQFADLAKTGQEGVTMLVQMLSSYDGNSVALAEYALNGLAVYASSEQGANVYDALIGAYRTAMADVSDPQHKNFLIRQLIIMGVAMEVEGEAPLKDVKEAKLKTKNPRKEVANALKKADRVERNRVLNLASAVATEPLYIDVVKELEKTKKDDVKVDILAWLGREAAADEKKNATIRRMEVKLDKPAYNVLASYLSSPVAEIRQSAAWALVRIGDVRGIALLAELLKSNDARTIELAKETLAAFPENINAAVAKVINDAPTEGQIAALELLAKRKADTQSTVVYKLMESTARPVRVAAYNALEHVVIASDFVRLCGMLEVAEHDGVTPLQNAIIASLAGQKPEAQVDQINKRILRAGADKAALYYKILATTGHPRALTMIQEALAGNNTAQGQQAFEAILLWPGVEAADVLYEICRNQMRSNYFERAFNAYIKLASAPTLTGENRLIGLRRAMEIAKMPSQQNTILGHVSRTGTFTALMFAGKYLDDKAVQQAAAQAVMNIALNHKEYVGTAVRQLLEKAAAVLDNPDAGYQREAIRKHLAEMPQEEGFVSLFNGYDLTGWKGLVGNPISRLKMSAAQMKQAQAKADQQMRKDWKIENGLLVFDGTGYDNLCSEKKYGDIEMYIDWMLDPAGPEADAGIYLRGTPQVQIWDTARVNVGAQVGSGGLYNNAVHRSTPTHVADNKMGSWNTFYIKMVGDRVTVVLNGEKVVDNVILENYWDRSQPIPAIEQLELQAHGSKVYYRDIYVRELPMVKPFELSADERKEGYQLLFDGTNMHHWVGNTADYTMQDGTISLVPGHGSGGNLYSKKEYGNFVLRFEFQLTPAANNGLGIRTPMEGDAAYVGMELQILDNEHPVYKDLEVYQYHGSVYGVIPAKRGALKPVGEWNYQEVVAIGDHIKITLNGEVILDGNIREASANGTVDKQKHPGLLNEKGHIGFLGHGSPVKFKNIRIKELR